MVNQGGNLTSNFKSVAPFSTKIKLITIVSYRCFDAKGQNVNFMECDLWSISVKFLHTLFYSIFSKICWNGSAEVLRPSKLSSKILLKFTCKYLMLFDKTVHED